MYQLTIARAGAAVTTTAHPDAACAHRALTAHAVTEDLYLSSTGPTSFELVRLDANQRDSRIVGTATITGAIS